MGNKYLPGTVQERIQDLMKERKITQSELTGIQSKFMAAVAEIKKSKESKTELSQKLTKEIGRSS